MNKINYLLFYIYSVFPFFCLLQKKYLGFSSNKIQGILLLIILFITILDKISFGGKINFPKYVFFFLLFSIYAIMSSLDIGRTSLFGLAKLIYSNPYLMTVYIFFIIENTNYNDAFIKNITSILYVMVFITLIVSLIQIYKPLFFINASIDMYYYFAIEQRRIISIYSWIDINSLGISFPAILSILYGQRLLKEKRSIYLIIAGGIVCFLNKSRYVMVSFFVASAQSIKINKRIFFNLIKYLASVVILLLISYWGLKKIGVDIDFFIKNRILSESYRSRILAFEMFKKFFPHNPFLGTGGIKTEELMQELGGRSSQIHVGYLSLFYYYGLIGGSIYLAFIYYLLKKLRHTAKKSGYWGSYFAFLTFLFANLTFPRFHLYEFGLILAIMFNKYYEQKMDNSMNKEKS